MTTNLEHQYKFEWHSPVPTGNKKVALLIPQYNESLHFIFEKRLQYFRDFAVAFKDTIDVIIIDDGSSDDSLLRMKSFLNHFPGAFFIASVWPNANKVGALFLTARFISHEFVVLSDFDTDIKGLQKVFEKLDDFRKDARLMGCYFRMLPYEGSGGVFLFQQLEYILARSLYKFHKKDKSVPVMPGAGSLYKRDILTSIYNDHSGLRSGEDREATLIGLKLGYHTIYMDNVLALTRPPLSFKALIKQRVRWNLGYLETFYKEKVYYSSQIRKCTTIGIRTLMEFLCVIMVILIPLFILISGLISWSILPWLLLLTYCGVVAWSVYLLMQAPEEANEFKGKRIYSSVWSYPLFKISLDYLAWMGALRVFIKKKYSFKNRHTG